MWHRTLRITLVVLLLVQVSGLAGCSSGYTNATLPDDPTEAEDLPEVRRGTEARVHLHSGEVVEGEVIEVSPVAVSIGKPGNFGYQETVCARSDIAKIEVLKAHAVLDALALVTAGAMVVIAAAAIAFAIAWNSPTVWT